MSLGVYVVHELAAPYDKGPTDERRRKYLRSMVPAAIGMLLSLAILLVVRLWPRAPLPPDPETGEIQQIWDNPFILTILGVHIALAVGRWLYFLIRWLLARQTLKKIPDGTALRIDRFGIAVADLTVPWAEVGRIEATSPIWWETGLIKLKAGAREAKLRVDQVPVEVSRIASAISLYSGGARQLDTTRLDR